MTTPTSSSSHPVTKALVTGHTRGIGAALAEQFLARGIAVLGVSRSRHATLAERFPELLDEAELDLADLARVEQWLAGDALRHFARDAQRLVLINNAGTVQPIGPCEVQDAREIARAVSLNVATPLMFASAFAAVSAGLEDRRIVHVSSGAARNAYAGWSIYCATKAALDHHARSVALDRSPALRICSVAPGVVDTGMQAEIRGMGIDRFPLRGKFDDLKRSGLLATPGQSASKLIGYVLSDSFGQTPTADVRDLPQA
ncbi:SDR family oxidoreductase [Trinickia terrae]|uniref:SDR family oxidoreductase n=1 Tax=Trinickia terrae TaxID=2571161 RepID=A0A4U1I645_9BURK|nr:SDR family oxidoreductase [Trinickia terrae]TKC88828.1 SDR family oxidoreductase [Trinickia terrae]